MPITSQQQGDNGTVTVAGLLTINVVPQFEAEVRKVIAGGVKSVAIDLADVDLICSAAIRTLLMHYKTLNGEGRSLAVINPSANVDAALETVGFAKLVRRNRLAVTGRIDGEAANQLEIDLVKLVQGDAPTISIDMSEVTFLCSAGIRVLLQYFRMTKKNDRVLQVTQPSAIAREALETTGFTDLIEKN
jgi:anti-anti-sigma factor